MQSSPLRFPFAWPGAAEPPVELATLREEPVVRVTLPSGDEAFLVTRYEDIRRVLSDPRVSRNRDRPGAPRMTEQKTKVFQNPRIDRDPPEHTRMRRLMAKAFTATRVEALRPHVRQVAEELVTDLLKQSPPVDLHEAFAVPLTLQVICGLLGVPPEDQARFRGSLGEAWQYMGELIEGKRRDPGDDLISALIGVHDEDDGRLSAHELHVWCVILLLAGFETTATQLGSGTVLLLTHPGQLGRLREDPGLIPDAVEELLRCQIAGHSLSMLRYVTDDIEVGGVTIPRGSGLIPILESANLDESVFPDPMRLDITRKNNQHLVFSAGPHFCMGAALARLELQVALEALIRKVPTLRLAVPPSALRHHDSPLDLGLREVPVAW
ncbi:cytochrome P450 [Nonomuraea sp. KC401]|uniref:cytochrome P450 n=1 Tax=unclassified Nonomuraea TaxID=2593643 RepID=UPI0010FF4511|nr:MULTISPECIES: cytochrome P450 [unclassified Nonomuraea]NBE93710.1 cytochrome P450 [Nonomuraea sp. K271]TLF76976.1 cytochrome P450 [Nonomuraea sp. KC401]